MPHEHLHSYISGVENDHRLLELLMRGIDATIEEIAERGCTPHAVATLEGLLTELHAHLLEHFAQEEQGGYMEEAVAVAPRFSHQVEQLLRQHAVLDRELAQLVRQVCELRKSPTRWQPFEQRLVESLKRLKAHEAGENRILEEAFNTDLGLSD